MSKTLGKTTSSPAFPVATVDPHVVPFTNPELVAAILDDRVHPSTLPARTKGVQVTTVRQGPTSDRPCSTIPA